MRSQRERQRSREAPFAKGALGKTTHGDPPIYFRVDCAPIVCFQPVAAISIRRACRIEMLMQRKQMRHAKQRKIAGRKSGWVWRCCLSAESLWEASTWISEHGGLRFGRCWREDVVRRVLRRSRRQLGAFLASPAGRRNAPTYTFHLGTLRSARQELRSTVIGLYEWTAQFARSAATRV
jgi:hypothetical protein